MEIQIQRACSWFSAELALLQPKVSLAVGTWTSTGTNLDALCGVDICRWSKYMCHCHAVCVVTEGVVPLLVAVM